MLGIFFIISGVILATLCIVSMFKNLIIRFNLTGSSLENIIAIALMIGAIICSLSITLDGTELDLALNQLHKAIDLPTEQLQLLKALIPSETKSASTASLIGYIMYIIHFFIFKKIHMQSEKQIEENSKHKWDF